MWMVTAEGDGGLFWEDPVCGNTREEVESISLAKWPDLPEGYVRILYKCDMVAVLIKVVNEEKTDD